MDLIKEQIASAREREGWGIGGKLEWWKKEQGEGAGENELCPEGKEEGAGCVTGDDDINNNFNNKKNGIGYSAAGAA